MGLFLFFCYSFCRMDQVLSARVFHMLLDEHGEETGAYETISLAADGSADLSGVADARRVETWKQFGLPDRLHIGQVFPRDGSAFLAALLRSNNQINRFRSVLT
jgi:hypothetical protein